MADSRSRQARIFKKRAYFANPAGMDEEKRNVGLKNKTRPCMHGRERGRSLSMDLALAIMLTIVNVIINVWRVGKSEEIARDYYLRSRSKKN